MKWKDLFAPTERRFFTYLLEQADATIHGMELLLAFMTNRSGNHTREEIIQQMCNAEKHGDELRRNIITDLKGTFVTPIDREDIFALSRTIDNILDYADSTIKELELYKVEPTNKMMEMVKALNDSVTSLRAAIFHLVNDPEKASACTVHAKKMENAVEDLYRHALAELFELDDYKYVMKIREIYRHLSNAADRVDEAADIIGTILIKGNV
ncbi:DUF47 family protein [Fodinisporobacter ferrooxydans]|uniref:DUF47 family protein n=1 Tax=Fodinisporobacter ferrooxydans TaxID=2901836 RepID=A0ABY4CNA8_9BACL|nr:DUF47 family protein [Alicyclobacillaceae bacterium MYW30-H2]